MEKLNFYRLMYEVKTIFMMISRANTLDFEIKESEKHQAPTDLIVDRLLMEDLRHELMHAFSKIIKLEAYLENFDEDFNKIKHISWVQRKNTNTIVEKHKKSQEVSTDE